MKLRTLTAGLLRAAETFPAITLTGPRQSGKTTLLKSIFGKTHDYLNLEDLNTRTAARKDPAGFIYGIKRPVILDEIQYAPDVLSYIKSLIDENRQPARWILTGSQNFALAENISESLAGRTAVLSLLPFSIAEQFNNGGKTVSVKDFFEAPDQPPKRRSNYDLTEIILRGSYPEVVSNPNIDREFWCGSYVTTYLERDVRNLKQVGDLGQYEVFLRTCAARTGQILDLSAIAREIGVSFTTARRWLTLLEASYQVLLLYPYYKNIGKRLIKRPKIYFTDTGLATYLLGINTGGVLRSGPSFGPIFETLVVTDIWKRFLHHGQMPTMYYLRTQDGLEIDLIIELAGKMHLIEIKASETINSSHTSALIRAKNNLGSLVASSRVISNSRENFSMGKGIINFSWKNLLTS